MTVPADNTGSDEFRTYLDDDDVLEEELPDPFATPPPDPQLRK
ncbi:hypothetical protein ACFVWG_21205 [Kribbella sp. NPDC058245]